MYGDVASMDLLGIVLFASDTVTEVVDDVVRGDRGGTVLVVT